MPYQLSLRSKKAEAFRKKGQVALPSRLEDASIPTDLSSEKLKTDILQTSVEVLVFSLKKKERIEYTFLALK